jgi:hypothetical protein
MRRLAHLAQGFFTSRRLRGDPARLSYPLFRLHFTKGHISEIPNGAGVSPLRNPNQE